MEELYREISDNLCEVCGSKTEYVEYGDVDTRTVWYCFECADEECGHNTELEPVDTTDDI